MAAAIDRIFALVALVLGVGAGGGGGANVLVVFYSQSNHTRALAQAVYEGAQSVAGTEAKLLPVENATFDAHVKWADAVLFGSPVHNANIAAPAKAWLDTWDYVHTDLHTKIGAPFATGGHLWGGMEQTLAGIANFFHVFGMKVVTAERDFQPHFPLGVGATTGDPPFNDTAPGTVNDIFVDAGHRLGARVAAMAAADRAARVEM
eukprot:g7494.t1